MFITRKRDCKKGMGKTILPPREGAECFKSVCMLFGVPIYLVETERTPDTVIAGCALYTDIEHALSVLQETGATLDQRPITVIFPGHTVLEAPESDQWYCSAIREIWQAELQHQNGRITSYKIALANGWSFIAKCGSWTPEWKQIL